MEEDEHLKTLLSKEYLHTKEVRALSELLTGEISAVEAYNLAIQKIRDVRIIPALEECRNSHALRVETLQDHMERLDGHCIESSGWWGAVACFVENSASVISDAVALSVLVAGEDFGFSQYEQHMKDLDQEAFTCAEEELLPAQGRTLEAISVLNAYMRSEHDKPSSKEEEASDEDQDKHSAA